MTEQEYNEDFKTWPHNMSTKFPSDDHSWSIETVHFPLSS